MPRTSTAMARELRLIHTSFRQLARAFTRIAPILAAVPAVKGVAAATEGKRPRKKPRLSAQLRAHLKLQGKYMGTMRGLPATKRAIVKKVRASKGIRAAIAKARRLAS